MKTPGKRVINHEIFLKLQALIAEITGNELEDITVDLGIQELRLSAVERAQLLSELFHVFQIQVTRDQLEGDFDTLSDLIEYIDDELA